MIKDDFYSTSYTDPVESDVEYTDNIANLTQSVDMFHPYVMGYVTSTYIPNQFLLSRYEIKVAPGEDDEGIEFDWAMDNAQNLPWFFLTHRTTSLGLGRGGQLIYNDNAWSDKNNTTGFEYQLLNSFNISLIRLRSFTLRLNYSVYDDTRVDWVRNFTQTTTISLTVQELIDFLFNGSKLTLNVLSLFSGYTMDDPEIQFDAVALIPGMAHIVFTAHHTNSDQDCEIHFRFVISEFFWSEGRIINEGGTSSQYPNATVAIQYTTNDDNQLPVVTALNSGRMMSSTQGYIFMRRDGNRIFELESGLNKFTIGNTNYICTGLKGRIPGNFVRSAPMNTILQQGSFIAQVVGSTRIAIVPYVLVEEMQKCLWECGLRIAEDTTPYGFSDDVWIPQYKTDDSPNYDLLNGDLETIGDKLRPWQMYNINDNDFTWDDVPPYSPEPPPGGDDNSETGDKIPNQFGRNVGVTSNFITQYLMTQGQISKLGEVLWTSWADDAVTMDMVENFYGKLHDATGSWNVSSALQFLVSCRMFPVSLATLVGTTATTSIPIGTGAFALQCGTSTEPTFFIANESVAVLNCGDVYIPKEFGDYRDFDNTNITAYLPYCGSVQLSPQDVVGKWLGCTYAIDLFDGSCKAFLYTLSGDDVGYEGAYYNVAIKEGQCGFLIPMSATQAGEVASRRKVDSYVDGSMLFNAGSTMLDGTMRIASGDGLGAIGADVGRLANLGFAYNTLSAQRMGRAGIAAPTIAGGSGFADFMQPASPYIQIRRSRYQMPIQYENSAAYPANAQNYGNLSQFTGFVQCKNVDVKGFTCHEEERSAIKALLESGVYL